MRCKAIGGISVHTHVQINCWCLQLHDCRWFLGGEVVNACRNIQDCRWTNINFEFFCNPVNRRRKPFNLKQVKASVQYINILCYVFDDIGGIKVDSLAEVRVAGYSLSSVVWDYFLELAFSGAVPSINSIGKELQINMGVHLGLGKIRIGNQIAAKVIGTRVV